MNGINDLLNEKELDVSKIKIIPSDTEIPVHDNQYQTKRPLCTNFPENATVLDRIEAIKVITDISEDLEQQDNHIEHIPQYIEELQAVFDPLNVEECASDLFKTEEYTLIESVEELKKYLSELLIRFDTNPNNYTKEDYLYLLGILYKSLIHLYDLSVGSSIVTEWGDTLRDNKVPSEKLVKETINTESQNRQQEIQDLYDDLFPLIAAAL